MKKISFFALLLMMIACRHATSRNELESNLKKSMTEYLYKSVKNDSSQVKFNVLTVTFFEEKNFYLCEFKVRMKRVNGLDTTGIMSADISKNFSKVMRKS